MDIELRRSMWDFLTNLNEQGITIILTTHYLEEAESLCRHIAIIDHGMIAENTDMKSLLEQLQVETFILDLARPVTEAPQLEGFEVWLRDAKTLEVAVPKSESLNTLFAELARLNFEVMSMRNKANRLEELFVRLVEQNLPGSRHHECTRAMGGVSDSGDKGNPPLYPYLAADPVAAGDYHDAVFRDFRQPYRQPHR